jgi:hypothetical protein
MLFNRILADFACYNSCFMHRFGLGANFNAHNHVQSSGGLKKSQ